MGKKGKSQTEHHEDLVLTAARKENDRLVAEEHIEMNARTKKLEAPPLHTRLFFVWAAATCCIPAGLFSSSAFRYASASMQPDKNLFVAAILVSSFVLWAAYRSIASEIRGNDPIIVRALCGGGSGGRSEVVRQATFRETSCFGVFAANACYFAVYGAFYHALPKGLVTSVSYAMCSIFSSCIVQLSSPVIAAAYPAFKGRFLRG